MSSSIKYYRNDLDLLRALAIISVVGYHLQMPYFNNGYVGVDIFFVLSGFLMAANIFSSLKDNIFKLSSFYLSRAKRIFPVYYLVLLTFLLFIFLFFDIKLYEYSLSALSSAIFTSNFYYYYLLSGYFQPKSELNLLLHTWSLSLEIQYYLICPFILIFIYKCKVISKNIIWFLFISLSIGCMWMLHRNDHAINFYMLPSRLWEFLAGALIFSLSGKYKPNFSERKTNITAGIGLLLIILFISGVVPIDKSSWPNFATVPIVLIVCSLIFLYQKRNFPKLLLIKYIALRSYSIYLWHWPLIVISKYFGWFGEISQKIVILLISLILSELSYKLLEIKSSSLSSKNLLVIPALSILTLSLSFLLIKEEKSLLRDQHTLRQFYLSYPRNNTKDQFGFRRGHLRYNESFSTYPRPSINSDSKEGENYLLIGDCYAAMFASTIREMAQEKGINLIQLTADEVFPSKEAISVYRGPKELMQWVFKDFIPSSHQRIKKVILMSNYSGYSKRQIEELIVSNNQYFSDFNIPIIYIGQTEQYDIELPVAIWLENRYGLNFQKRAVRRRELVNAYLKSLIPRETYIDIFTLPTVQHSDGYSSYIYDTEHFSTFGTRQYKPYLEQIFKSENYY